MALLKKDQVFYFLEDTDGNPLALDDASGGYPYIAPSLMAVKFWPSYEAATAYLKVIDHKKVKGYTIHYIVNIVTVKTDEMFIPF